MTLDKQTMTLAAVLADPGLLMQRMHYQVSATKHLQCHAYDCCLLRLLSILCSYSQLYELVYPAPGVSFIRRTNNIPQ